MNHVFNGSMEPDGANIAPQERRDGHYGSTPIVTMDGGRDREGGDGGGGAVGAEKSKRDNMMSLRDPTVATKLEHPASTFESFHYDPVSVKEPEGLHTCKHHKHSHFL